MSAPANLWNRVRDEVRSVSSRTKQGARKVFDEGVLRVDLVSLRRERRRALADLGERALIIWNLGELSRLESDPEMLRLRARVEGVDAAIAAKEADLVRLRTATDSAPSAPDSEATQDPTPKP
jgi:hypothetical protein